MKKTLAILLALLLTFALAACGDDGPDVSELTDVYGPLAVAYDSMVNTAVGNGWDQNAEMVEQLNTITDQLAGIKAIIEDPTGVTQEEIDALTAACEGLTAWTEQTLQTVSEPYGG